MEVLTEDKWYILGCEMLTYDCISNMTILLGCKEVIIQHHLSGLTQVDVQKVCDVVDSYSDRKRTELATRKKAIIERSNRCYGEL
jgi:hypothetical protein